jgi:hypothetical protein
LNVFITILNNNNMEKIFPNGFESWAETHHEIVSAITLIMDQDNYPVKLEEIQHSQGKGGIWEFCLDLTNEFEELNKDKDWDGEYFDELEEFIESKINEE